MSGTELRQLREALGLGRVRFARLLGVHFKTIEKWEYGQRQINAITAAGIRAKLAEAAQKPAT